MEAMQYENMNSKPPQKLSFKKILIIIFVIIFVVVVVVGGILLTIFLKKKNSDKPKSNPNPNPRLSTDIIPTHYELYFHPDLPAKSFIANLSLTSKTNKNSSTYTLNADSNLTISKITGVNSFEHKDGMLIMQGADFTSVYIEFTGTLDLPDIGWYYIHDRFAITQFETINARKTFPCFDDPSVKSTFSISIETHLTALSNMPVETVTPTTQENKLYKFPDTPPMPTYLVALVVGEFSNRSGVTKSGKEVIVYAEPGREDYLDFPLQESIAALDFYEDYFGVPFAMPKLQSLSAAEFRAGAMENYGMVIYRETYFLVKENNSVEFKMQVSNVIFHEIAHQWCGDLVSPAGWKNTWLNEGFATYFSYFAMGRVHPEWDCEAMTQSSVRYTAMAYDQAEHTHPIYWDCDCVLSQEIGPFFDTIGYEKAGSVIATLVNHVGEDVFRTTMGKWFGTYAEQSAGTDAFIALFSTATGEDMDAWLGPWLRQTHYPLVTVANTTLTQSVFSLQGEGTGSRSRVQLKGGVGVVTGSVGEVRAEAKPVWEAEAWTEGALVNIKAKVKAKAKVNASAETEVLWKIPVSISGGLDVDLNGKTLTIDTQDRTWFVLNSARQSFFRTVYDTASLARITPHLPEIPRVARALLLEDYSNLAQAGIAEWPVLVGLLSEYAALNDSLAAETVVRVYGTVRDLFLNADVNVDTNTDNSTNTDSIERFGVHLYDTILATIGTQPAPGEPAHVASVRAAVKQSYSLTLGNEAYVAEAVLKFQAYRTSVTEETPLEINPSELLLILRCGNLRVAGGFDFLVGLLQTAIDTELRTKTALALGFVDPDPATGPGSVPVAVERVFDVFATAATNDKPLIMQGLVSNERLPANTAWRYFKEHFGAIVQDENAIVAWRRVLAVVLSRLRTEEEANEVEAFFATHVLPLAEAIVSQSLELIRLRARTEELYGDAVDARIEEILGSFA